MIGLWISVMNAFLDENVSGALKRLWITKAQSKFFIFGWRLVLNRLPTRVNLVRCVILFGLHNLVCPLCCGKSENSDHLFRGYLVLEIWWINTYAWLQVDMHIEQMPSIDHIQMLQDFIKSRLKVDLLDYLALQKLYPFYGGLLVKFDGSGMIKFLSWKWFITVLKPDKNLSWSEWCNTPA